MSSSREIPNAKSLTSALLQSATLPVPARLLWLQDQLLARQLPAELFMYRRNGKNHFNLYCQLKSEHGARSRPILVTAHWDTVNTQSDNCLDNTASLFNLVELGRKLKQRSAELGRDVILAWTDAEESQSTYLCGAVEAALAYQPELLLDLELTAGGTHILSSTHGTVPYDGVSCPPRKTEMPGNNAVLVWNLKNSGLLKCLEGAACLTLVDDADLKDLEARGFCNRWSHCHRESDSFDRWLNPEEMDRFTDWLVDLILAY
jgi:hypothetical protein